MENTENKFSLDQEISSLNQELKEILKKHHENSTKNEIRKVENLLLSCGAFLDEPILLEQKQILINGLEELISEIKYLIKDNRLLLEEAFPHNPSFWKNLEYCKYQQFKTHPHEILHILLEIKEVFNFISLNSLHNVIEEELAVLNSKENKLKGLLKEISHINREIEQMNLKKQEFIHSANLLLHKEEVS